MATYVQGVTDYIPELQPFQPDFNMLANVLQTKQSRYDAAHKQLSSVYGTLLNSPMLREQNIEARDQFFKSIDQEIQRMSGIDLSLQQNQSAAMDVFKGLYEDKNVVKDMMWTKNYMNELKRADAFKTCVDPKKCGGSWWEGGVKVLNYKAQEFKNASTEDALNFADVSYVAAQDFTDDAIKLAKDSGFNVKFDQIKGDWIVTTKNGKEMIQPLADFYLSRYGNDGKIVEFYKTRAYLNRMDWVTANQSNYADVNEANMAYISNLIQASKRTIDQGKNEAKEAADAAENKSKLIDKTIKEQGYIPSMNWLDGWREDKAEVGTTQDTLKVYDDADNNLKALGINKDNVRFAVDNFDSVMGFNLLRETTYNVAEAYASLNQEVTFKENPYAVQAKANAFQLQRDREKEGYFEKNPITGERVYVPGTDFAQKLELQKIEKAEQERAAQEFAKNLTPYSPQARGGEATVAVDLNKAYKDNVTQRNVLGNQLVTSAKEYVRQGIIAAQQAYKTYQVNPQSGASLDDLTVFVNGVLGVGSKKYGIDPKALITGDNKAMANFDTLLQDENSVAYVWANTKKQFNSGSDGFLNNPWVTDDTRNKLSGYDKNMNLTKQLIDAHVGFTKEQSQLAMEYAEKDLNQKAKTEDPEDVQEMKRSFDLFKQVYDENNIDGFLADDPAKSKILDQKLKAIADQRVKAFIKSNPAAYNQTNRLALSQKALDASINAQAAATPSGGGILKVTKAISDFMSPLNFKTVEETAYNDVVKEYKQGYGMWRQAYSDRAASWTNPKGGKATDDATIGYSGTIDVAAGLKYSQANIDFMDMANNFNRLRDDVKVYYGNFENTGEKYRDGDDNDEGAIDIVDQAIRDFVKGTTFSKTGVPTDDSRIVAGFEVTPIAAADDKVAAFRLVPSKTWGKQYRSTDGKTDKLITTDDYADQGIVVYMPKDKMQSEYLERTKTDSFDFIMETTGKLEIKNPDAGNITVQKEGNMYAVYMNLLEYSPSGENISQAYPPTYHDLTLDLGDLYKTFSENLDYNALLNRTTLSNAAQQYKGDPDQILFNSASQ